MNAANCQPNVCFRRSAVLTRLFPHSCTQRNMLELYHHLDKMLSTSVSGFVSFVRLIHTDPLLNSDGHTFSSIKHHCDVQWCGGVSGGCERGSMGMDLRASWEDFVAFVTQVCAEMSKYRTVCWGVDCLVLEMFRDMLR